MSSILYFLVLVFATFANADFGRPRHCEEIRKNGLQNSNGIYEIFPQEGSQGTQVLCDFPSNNETAWTTILKRIESNHRNFWENWDEYVAGFGNVSGSYWVGLDDIHAVTSGDEMELRFDLMDWDGLERFAEYSTFHVGNGTQEYPLSVNGYSGDAGDAFGEHNGMKFSTYDNDNDISGVHCAELFMSGWWFRSCYTCNLNGIHSNRNTYGIRWDTFHSDDSLMRAEMKIRPRSL